MLKLIFPFIFISISALAHESHHQNPSFAVPKTEKEAILRVLNLFHFAIDGEHEHIDSYKDFLKQTVHPKTLAKMIKNANLVRVGNNAYRAFNIETEHQITRKHARNMAFIFPLSHSIEMASAPTFLVFSQIYDFSTAVTLGGTAILSVIALPGTDILCWLIFFSYPAKMVHQPINFVVEGLFKAIDKVMPQLQNYERGDGLERISIALEQVSDEFKQLMRIEKSENKITVQLLTERGSEDLKLTFKKSQGATSLQRVKLRTQASVNRARVLKFSKQILSFNSQHALKQIMEAKEQGELNQLSKQFFVEKMYNHTTGDFVDINFTPRALIVRGNWQKTSCQSLFQAAY